eukprot:GCRY01004450.1.p1 GENE.GCRY01004450.1~~GCRY01004450.1.p1  ORF type:complete len:339 (-),score=46.50 GCRY01004450.1:98-1114(-)
MKKSSCAFVLDIDGVVWCGGKVCPGSDQALQFLLDPQNEIPVVFLTNGGDVGEKEKADKIRRLFGFDISPKQIIVAHSPSRLLLPTFGKELILAVGPPNCADLVRGYGFENVMGISEYLALFPFLVPTSSRPKPQEIIPFPPVRAIFYTNEDDKWEEPLQVCLDILSSTRGIPGDDDVCEERPQQTDIIFCNPDFTYPHNFKTPRLTVRAFKLCLEALFKEKTGVELRSVQMGKPTEMTYRYCEQSLTAQAAEKNFEVERIIAVGDNPKSDIKGANAMKSRDTRYQWTSVLVKTGIFKGPNNDPVTPADHVMENLLEVVQSFTDLEVRPPSVASTPDL